MAHNGIVVTSMEQENRTNQGAQLLGFIGLDLNPWHKSTV